MLWRGKVLGGAKEQYCGKFNHVWAETKMTYDDLYDEYITANSKADPSSIHHEMISNLVECDDFFEKLVDEFEFMGYAWGTSAYIHLQQGTGYTLLAVAVRSCCAFYFSSQYNSIAMMAYNNQLCTILFSHYCIVYHSSNDALHPVDRKHHHCGFSDFTILLF
jgi:hypothetical protein